MHKGKKAATKKGRKEGSEGKEGRVWLGEGLRTGLRGGGGVL